MSSNVTPAKSNVMNIDSHGIKKHNLSTMTVVFMIYSLVAAGCYGIEDMIPASGPGLTLIILIVLPIVWGLPFGLVASELGSARPQEGGYYKWVQEALGEFWGFMAGWWRTISIYIDNTLYVVLAGGYIAGQLAHENPYLEFGIKLLMILIFTAINLRGVRDVGIVATILSILVIVAFLMVAIIGFANWGGNPFEPLTAEPAEGFHDWIVYIGGGIAVGMWMYSGYESMSTIAGELEDPQVISRATLISVPIIMLTYIIPTMASLAAFKGEGDAFDFSNWGSTGDAVGYSEVASHFMGPAFGMFFVIVAVAAQCLIFNSYIASGSRGFFALAEDKLAPAFLVKVDKKHGVPYVAVISVAVVNIILCMIPFQTLIVVDVFLLVSSYILVYISAIILRKKIPKEEYKFRIPGGHGFLVVLCVVPIIIAFASFLINGTDFFIGGMIGIVTGPILYAMWKWMKGGLAAKDPEQFPLNKKTRLALGDMNRMTILFGILFVIGFIGSYFLPWFETTEIETYEYYIEEYSQVPFMFWTVDLGFFQDFDLMLKTIKIGTIVSGALTAVFFVLSSTLEPKKNKSGMGYNK